MASSLAVPKPSSPPNVREAGRCERTTRPPQRESLTLLLQRLNDFDLSGNEIEPTIYAAYPWTPDSNATVLDEDPIRGHAPTAPELRYLLEVALARDALDMWSRSRNGARPDPAEALDAVVHYAAANEYLLPRREME